MRKQRYFPSRTAEQIRWLGNFAEALPRYQSALELSDAELAALVADARYAAYALGGWLDGVRQFASVATAAVEHLLHGDVPAGLPVFTPPPLPDGVAPVAPGALERIFRTVQRLKHAPNFGNTIATDLGLTTTNNTPDRPTPQFTQKIVRTEAGPQVQLRFCKYRHPGVWIECRWADGHTEVPGIAGASVWLDPRSLRTPGQPEMREYRMRFYKDSAPTGDWTPWKSITVPAM